MTRILIGAGVLLIVAPALEAQDFEFRRELAAGNRFALRNIIGDVRIDGSSGRAVEVTARKKPGRHGDPADVEIKAVETDGGVAICVYYPNQSSRRRDDDRSSSRPDRDRRRHRDDDVCHRGDGWGNNNRNDTSVDFVVRLPAGLKLDLKTVAGDVVGQGLRGENIDVGTVSGDLRMTDVTAAVLDAASVSGDVDLDRVRAREVSAETVSGNVSYTGEIDWRGGYDFRTLSGDVVLTLAGEPDAQVSAMTFSGDLTSDFPVTRDSARKRRNRFNATWGKGGAQIDLESFSGDIEIRRSR